MKQASIVLVAALVGVTVGLGFYTFVYARGYAYLTNNPEACANCHVMQEYYDAWIKSPHRAAPIRVARSLLRARSSRQRGCELTGSFDARSDWGIGLP